MTAPPRDWLFLGCERGHDWRSLGGCNADCHHECCCSVPVNFCRRCGDCDYGDNTEAEQVRLNCAALWSDPASRWTDRADLSLELANGESK